MNAKNDHFAGFSVPELAKKYGTPLFLYDVKQIYEQIYRIKENIHSNVKLFYSLKANPNPSIVNLIYKTGTNIEISSILELKVAKALKIDPARIMYLGPGKTKKEIETVFEYGVKYFVAESKQELEVINKLGKVNNSVVEVGIRINPNLVVKGARLQMSGAPRQFGIDEDQVDEVIQAFENFKNLKLTGLHVYHGTRILSADVVSNNTKEILGLFTRLIEQHKLNISYVGIGGGLGVPYFSDEEELDIIELGQKCNPIISEFINRYKNIEILMESGRFLTASSGVYISEVLYTKVSKNQKFAVIDGGTHHYGATGGNSNIFMKNFPIHVFTSQEREIETVSLAGKLCTPNDLIAKKVSLPKLQQGDLIGVLQAGAYGLTASPVLFLSHYLPKEVLLYESMDILIRDHNEYEVPIFE
ncbi:alanine racemase [Cytobacillus oceanisediminis]|uniref:alanine racemase n=1 Tax=Cytobacillus oceanisediminis TaxID=665099 RepID=UPI001C228CB9|nr:alanine racemase [Cytobacillus oceanisediminis]MBU8772057.1 alanine racemase [Cytobacillus oceanisediminis]